MNNLDPHLVHTLPLNAQQQLQLPAAAASKVIDRAKSSSVHVIRRYPKSDSKVPFIKFGPLFGEDDEDHFVKKAKEEAWQHVVSFSKSREAIVTEIYMSSIRQIENIAKASYDPESALDKLSNKDFRDMMLKDSCLFLQLLFSLLLNDEDDIKFPHLENISLKNRHKWVESMLHIGNQIPMVVLREILKKNYFQRVVKNGKWKEPSSDLAKQALFKVVISPELYRRPGPPWPRLLLACVGKHAHWMQQLKECRDLLHGIHIFLLGPEVHNPEKEQYDDDDDDDDNDDDDDDDDDRHASEEENTDALAGGSSSTISDAGNKAKMVDHDDADDDDSKIKNVIKLQQAGVHFGITKEGIRGIKFKSNLINPKLYLPPLFVGFHTRLLLRRIKQYEQNLDLSLWEVTSYLQFLRDLVHTTRDAKVLAFYGIIKGKRKYIQMLPIILVDLIPHRKIIMDTSLNPLKMEINSFYRPPWVSTYFTIVFALAFFGMVVSVVQTTYAMLAYHKPPPS